MKNVQVANRVTSLVYENSVKEQKVHSYTKEELDNLKEFVKFVQNDKERATLACWGDHS